jgi:hypothetical protein
MFVLAIQLFLPAVSYALTTGPSQPEVQSFEPVGTTDMVDMFSGDFVYNIPLMDVEGYPVNISYHGGVNMEQEATWVGLGWNINPGEINRSVRGIPDDFNGDTLSKELHIKDEKTLRVGVGVGGEIVGAGDPFISVSLSLGADVNISNYKGVSCDINLGGGVNVFHCASVGVNIGVGSQTGADIDLSANLSLATSQIVSSDIAGGIGVGVSQGYSTRTGISDLNFSVTANGSADGASTSLSTTDNIPVGIRNFVPVITNSSTMSAIYGRIKFGLELFWCLGYGTINASYSTLHYNNDGSKDAYGYMYLQNASAATTASILDFTRDHDGQFNMSMQYLPPASMTYDIYSVNGQGTGGVFRPYRNDFGSVYDPSTNSTQSSNSLGLEAGIGDIFEIGGDATISQTNLTSGPYLPYLRTFSSNTSGSLFENVYMKEGGELTSVDPAYFSQINGFSTLDPTELGGLGPVKANSTLNRDARANLVYYFTATEASKAGVGTNPNIVSYTSTDGFASSSTPSTQVIPRIGNSPLGHKKDEISEIVQLQKDGRKYVYGIPAMNRIQKEATFSVNPSNANLNDGLVAYSPTDDGTTNSQGMDNYYSSTTTPAYAHSYLLTSILSSDYVDVTGDGVTDDDLGSYTKLNYSLKDTDYRWKAPFDSAQYNRGFWSEPRDDKGSYESGSREEWLLHSVETRNFVAEFYTSQRNDACGSTAAIVNSGKYDVAPYNAPCAAAPSYKLDSIKLYNKHDRFINGNNAVPVKTVFFVYSDSLCTGIPNRLSMGSGSGGKLTLNKIYFRYGSSQRSMMSPYQFQYGFNPSYNLANKDRWGGYKPNNPVFPNSEYPFVNQNDASDDMYASAWSLTNISLPSGGVIQANYEADDYAYVQDKPANEMFMIQGVGNGTTFNPSSQLYVNKNNPYLYVYFQRRTASEIPGLSFNQNYFNGQTTLYYNFNVKLTNSNKTYEQIKGYANVSNMGVCSDNPAYGYIQLQPVTPTGGGANLNPVTFTALNTARYDLPQIIFPGSNPDESSFMDIISGLKEAFEELVSITKNPIIGLVNKSDAKTVNLSKSFIRLQSVGLHKKGGGQRVKSLLFFDSWNTLAGGNEQQATYGKNYDYTIKDDTYGVISSGVASYEPMVGGDENPFRQPVPYIVASGSNWPPNNPVDLYQETPIGESLFPPGSVGYSKVTVTSIHAAQGLSSQGIDVSQFYTAKDFPAQVTPTAINATFVHHFDLFSQENTMTATQGYTLLFNDMHGKPKSVEHYVYKPSGGTTQLISYQNYNYRTANGKLDNNVSCLVYQPGNYVNKMQMPGNMVVRQQQLGVEEDVTIDTRDKDELTQNNTFNANLNVSGILFFVIPIPWGFGWGGKYHNQFRSATVTKVIQQYGILDNVQAFNENAITIQKNEIFDPKTGQVVVTSVNNEYHDKEYSVSIPAYWAYSGMAPAYNNIKYEADIPSVYIDSNYIGSFVSPVNLNTGDKLLIDYPGGETEVWCLGSKSIPYGDCFGYILPRYPQSTPGWNASSNISGVHIKVIESGARNMLNQTIETYSMMDSPIDTAGVLKTELDSLISIKGTSYCDSNTRIIHNYIANPDTINPYAIGERGVYRMLSEYAFLSNRNYDGFTSRNAGLFNAPSLYNNQFIEHDCIQFPYNYYALNPFDSRWTKARTVTKWSPYGKEVENVDAIGNFSTAVYGYNEDLPTAVASNARQGEVLADGFEDYSLLHVIHNIMGFNYSPFNRFFSTTDLAPASTVYNMLKLLNTSTPSIVSTTAHTGMYCLSVPASPTSTYVYPVNMPMNPNNDSIYHNYYNTYFSYVSLPSMSVLPDYNMSSANEYLSFQINQGKSYMLSYWIKQATPLPNTTTYSLNDSVGVKVDTAFYAMAKNSNVIDGWQQEQVTFNVPANAGSVRVLLPAHYYVDDFRIFPSVSDMKSFVYNPVNEKLMATLDENNFATLYEYDQEGNLVRVKKETEKGIMTVSESRSSNPKQ